MQELDQAHAEKTASSLTPTGAIQKEFAQALAKAIRNLRDVSESGMTIFGDKDKNVECYSYCAGETAGYDRVLQFLEEFAPNTDGSWSNRELAEGLRRWADDEDLDPSDEAYARLLLREAAQRLENLG
jgi:hypothetical protein